MKRMPTLVALLPLLVAPALAQDAQLQAFTDFRAAVALDDRCHFLAFFERHRLGTIQAKLLEPLSFYGAYTAGKLTHEQYLEQFDTYDAEAQAAEQGPPRWAAPSSEPASVATPTRTPRLK